MTITNLLIKYKSLIAYAFFGVCTTLVNLATYWLCFHVLRLQNVPSAILAWFFAVSFAFITNKLWVFESKSFAAGVFWIELVKFYAYRIGTGILEVAMIWLAVDILHWHAMLWKFISLAVIIVLQFIGSKFWIFVSGRANSAAEQTADNYNEETESECDNE